MINLVKEGNMEKTCDLCYRRCPSTYYDAKTKNGPWATLCSVCYEKVGIGLGTGKGQQFAFITGYWKKVGG
jgi:hypothetical protein